MKRFLLCFYIVSVLLSLVGCYDYKEINDTAMVAGIAVDVAEAGQYRVSVEVIVPGESDSSSPKGKVLYEVGPTVEICLKKTVNTAAKQLQFSHCKIVVFSDEILNLGIADHLDYFLRNPEYRGDLYLAAVNGSASEMLAAGEKEARIASYDYVSVIENSYEETGAVPGTKLYQTTMDYGLSLLPRFSEKDGKYAVTGSFGIRDGKKFAEIDLQMTQSILLLSGEYQRGELSLKTQDGIDVPCQIRVVNVDRRILEGTEVVLEVLLECDILLTTLPQGFDISSEEAMEKTEEKVAQLLTETLERHWDLAKRMGIQQIFGAEIYCYRHAPELYFERIANGDASIRPHPVCIVQLSNFGFSNERVTE